MLPLIKTQLPSGRNRTNLQHSTWSEHQGIELLDAVVTKVPGRYLSSKPRMLHYF